MELPQYRKDQEMTPLEEGDAGNVEGRDPQLKIRAGHISLAEHGHSGEINLNDKPERPLHLPKMPDVEVPAGTFSAPNGPAFQPVQFNAAPKPQEMAPQQPVEAEQPQVARHDRSAWHEIGLDADGNVIETPHGHAFQQETQPEQMMQGAVSAVPGQDQTQQQQSAAATNPPQSAQQPMIQPFQAQPMQQTPQSFQQQPPQPQPMQQPMMQQPQPMVSQVQQPGYPQQQPVYGGNMAQPQFVQQPVQPQASYPHMPPLSGAVNPSYQTHPGQAALPTGQPTHADPQHMLAQPRKFSFNWKSPWLWLAVGMAMIIYFGSSLFS